jgi:hypothetical protein
MRHKETAASPSRNGSRHHVNKLRPATVRRRDPTTAAPAFVVTDREKKTLRVFDEVFLFQISSAVEIDFDSASAERSN